MRKATAANAWKLVLDNLPVEKENGEKKGLTQEGKGAEGAGESDDDRRVEALRSQKKMRQGILQENLRNIQTEGGSLKDQYITGKREETEEKKEQIEAEDTSMTEGASTAKEEKEEEIERGKREKRRKGGNVSEKVKVGRDENRLVNFGPYRRRTYGEVLREKPGYVKFLTKENQKDDQEARFAHWVMAFVVGDILLRRGRRTGGRGRRR